ncbi:hypothetical protein L1887_15190 [Cichorium endivia]|nr:hypothetical protein L1887_15190 [Cichorium endivia]
MISLNLVRVSVVCDSFVCQKKTGKGKGVEKQTSHSHMRLCVRFQNQEPEIERGKERECKPDRSVCIHNSQIQMNQMRLGKNGKKHSVGRRLWTVGHGGRGAVSDGWRLWLPMGSDFLVNTASISEFLDFGQNLQRG